MYCWFYEPVFQSREVMKPIILVTKANIWCAKITVLVKWVTTSILTMTQVDRSWLDRDYLLK